MNAVELKNITKRFARVVANNNVDLIVRRGEIHAVVGENGAGKTTLMRILYGMIKPDSGKIFINERAVNINDPSDAISLGLGMVHQHFMLIPVFTVTENVILGMEPTKGAYIDYKTAKEKVKEISTKYGLEIDPDLKIEQLPIGIQERVEILKLLYRGADILILDEPTAVLTPRETKELFKIMRSLKEQGKTIILITHKLDEVLEISDRVTVMRQGRSVGVLETEKTTKEEIAELMVGRPVLFEVQKGKANPGEIILELKNVCAGSQRRQSTLKDVSLTVRSGEIHGIAGVEGNGQTELVEVITGLRKIKSGEILFRGLSIANESPRKIFELGIAHVPEDRQKFGLVLDFTLYENLILGLHYRKPFSSACALNFRRIFKEAEDLIYNYDIRPRDYTLPARNLSGGNQQKLIMAREMNKHPQLLVASHPTRGVDIGGIEFIHKKLIEARDKGAGILLVSADLSELLSLCDRISVIYNGIIVGTFLPGELNEFQLGLLMTGGTQG